MQTLFTKLTEMTSKWGGVKLATIFALGVSFSAFGETYTSQSYAQNEHMIAQWDGIDNVGTGKHDPNSLIWKDLKGDIDLIGRSIDDAVIEPARARLVAHIKEAEAAAKANGAISSCIGGSGPCILSLFNKDQNDGTAIAKAIEKVYSDNGMKCDTWITNCGSGCRRI